MSNAIVITWTSVHQAVCFLLVAGCIVHLRLSLCASSPQHFAMPAIVLCFALLAMVSTATIDEFCYWCIIIGMLCIAFYVFYTAWFMVKIGSLVGQVTSLRINLDDWTDLHGACICLAVCIGMMEESKLKLSDAQMAALGDMIRELVRMGVLEARYHGAEFRWARAK